MAIIRKRLLFWLIRAYIKKWDKVIAFSFLIGLSIFFTLIYASQNLSYLFPHRKEQIGLVGAYTSDNLPPQIMNKISRGLTKVTADGKVEPDVATSWEIQDNGKMYVFHLRDDLTFVDGDKVTSETITYEFADVTTERPDGGTIVFRLENPYAPFLVTASRPIFKDGLKGIGEYSLADLKLNGTFLSSLSLTSAKDKRRNEMYTFYPNQEAVKTAFMLGESTKIQGINSMEFMNTKLDSHSNITVEKGTNYSQLVTIFYNTNDSILSDSKVRRGLTYALPNNFVQGERSLLPYSPLSQYYNDDVADRKQDLEHAKLLLTTAAEAASQSAVPTLTMKTLTRYVPVAKAIVNEWQKTGVKVTIEEVTSVPSSFQLYLGDFSVPKDPDQYTLWHSNQPFNITNFRNLRIDKLLEDGRVKTNVNERKQIYADFQKYLLDDAPASFLYFPYTYTVTRK